MLSEEQEIMKKGAKLLFGNTRGNGKTHAIAHAICELLLENEPNFRIRLQDHCPSSRSMLENVCFPEIKKAWDEIGNKQYVLRYSNCHVSLAPA